MTDHHDAGLLRLPVTFLLLGTRARNCLRAEGVQTVGDLMQFTEKELRLSPCLGRLTLEEITDALGRHGLSLPTVERRDKRLVGREIEPHTVTGDRKVVDLLRRIYLGAAPRNR